MNYPAYLIGGGNPVIVAWFWVLVGLFMFVTSFFMARKLFGVFPAIVYVSIIAAKLVPKSSEIFEPMAIYFVMPFFLYMIIQYVKTKKLSFLVGHLIALSIFIHLSIGIGLQFLILSTAIISFVIIRSRKWKHLLSFIVLPVSLINLIVFDIKYGFGMTKALFSTGGATKFFVTIPEWIDDRMRHMVSLELLNNTTFLWLPIFVLVMFFTFLSIKNDKKQRPIYILFLIYYFGYLALSFFNKGLLLTHYMFLLIPLTSLWVVSFLKGKYKVIFIPILATIFLLNLQYAIGFTNSLKTSYIGRAQDSWVGLLNVAKNISSSQEGKEFGYYVFAPDSYAYQPRYAMIYGFKKYGAKSFEYEKLDTTLVIAQAPPKNDKYKDYKWWVKVPVGIVKDPVGKTSFPNGYTVLKYNLTENEKRVEHDKAIELGIHFR